MGRGGQSGWWDRLDPRDRGQGQVPSTTVRGAAASARETTAMRETAATACATWVFLGEIIIEIAEIVRFWITAVVRRFGFRSWHWMPFLGIIAAVA